MKQFYFLIVLSIAVHVLAYEESTGELLSQCRLNREVHSVNRSRHLCEKPDVDEDFSYSITEMEARYSNQKFWCFSFVKEESFKLRFKFWFSHANYSVNAVSSKFHFFATLIRNFSRARSLVLNLSGPQMTNGSQR